MGIAFTPVTQPELGMYGRVDDTWVFVFGLRDEDGSEAAWAAAVEMKRLMYPNAAGVLIDVANAITRPLSRVETLEGDHED